jgi:hypothetical protein
MSRSSRSRARLSLPVTKPAPEPETDKPIFDSGENTKEAFDPPPLTLAELEAKIPEWQAKQKKIKLRPVQVLTKEMCRRMDSRYYSGRQPAVVWPQGSPKHSRVRQCERPVGRRRLLLAPARSRRGAGSHHASASRSSGAGRWLLQVLPQRAPPLWPVCRR